jgi:hypothetical protein
VHILTETATDRLTRALRAWNSIALCGIRFTENRRVASAQVVAIKRRARVDVTAVALVVAVGGHRAAHARAERHVGQVGALRLVVVRRHTRAARRRVGGARVNKD